MENSTGVSLVRRSQGMTEAQDVLRKSGEQKRHIKEQKQRFVNLRAQVEAQRARQGRTCCSADALRRASVQVVHDHGKQEVLLEEMMQLSEILALET
ncbi:hypothetical protein T484DRAFT_1842054 [Baffinella frigidus]|nr:hypothetical protein T484DRAFT_1842054 [Cryptophyta sp. CCMP2293]